MRTLILNSSNVVSNTQNSQYSYSISGGIKIDKGDQICIQSITIPYSNFNITSSYNNNMFGYVLNGITYQINISNGFYGINDLNNLLQATFIANGHYIVDSNSNNFFFCQLTENTAKYAYEFDTYAIPTTLPSGYTNPANVLYHTITFSTPTTIQLYIPSNNFGSIIGFSSGLYPATPSTINSASLSNIVPIATPVNNYIILCNAINNRFSSPPNVLYSFPINTSFGNNININPTFPAWVDMNEGSYASITLSIVDQNFNAIPFNDYNVCIQLLIRSNSEK